MYRNEYVRLSLFILSFGMLFILLISISFLSSRNNVEEIELAEGVSVSVDLNKKEKVPYVTKEILDKNKTIYYPVGKSEIFNNKVKKILDKYITMFEKGNKEEWKIKIIYNVDKFSDNINSFVFNVELEEGGNYPSTYIETLTYDFKNNEELKLENILKDYDRKIVEISNFCYDTLCKNEKIKNIGNFKKVKEGTSADNPSNFKKFSLDKNTLIIYFERYEVAPYVAGELNVCIPIEDMDLNIKKT